MKINIKRLKKSKIINFIYRFSIRITSKRFPRIASEILYFGVFGKKLNINKPKTFNEKLMWIKLYEDDSLKTLCSDKYKVREYVSNKGLKDILNELYYIYDNSSQINYEVLPNEFVLKSNKGSGGNIICRNKGSLNIPSTNIKLDNWINTDYSLISAEKHGKNIEPKILCEKYLNDPFQKVPIDYKFHCFHGNPKIVELVVNRYEKEQTHLFLDLEWKNLNYTKYNTVEDLIKYKPNNLQYMIEVSEKLSQDFTYVRVDLYNIEDKVIFGELTFTPAGCCDTDLTEYGDVEMGKLLKI